MNMVMYRNLFSRAVRFFILCTVVCGILYTGLITGAAAVLFPYQSQGSLIEVGGKKYGSELVGQPYSDPAHLWGRVMDLDVSTYKDSQGRPLLYAGPSNVSPASAGYGRLVAQRVAQLQAADPHMGDTPVPVDLVTGSGSGLDPAISPAAAAYQVKRIARARSMSPDQVQAVIDRCTTGRFLGIFGEPTVNVLKVNLMLDGILS